MRRLLAIIAILVSMQATTGYGLTTSTRSLKEVVDASSVIVRARVVGTGQPKESPYQNFEPDDLRWATLEVTSVLKNESDVFVARKGGEAKIFFAADPLIGSVVDGNEYILFLDEFHGTIAIRGADAVFEIREGKVHRQWELLTGGTWVRQIGSFVAEIELYMRSAPKPEAFGVEQSQQEHQEGAGDPDNIDAPSQVRAGN